MGTCGAEQSGRCNAEARTPAFCRAASAETGVAERVGMFRHRADRGWVYRVSSRNESGTDQKPDKGAAVMLNDFSGADKVYIVWARHCITCWSSGHTYFAIWKTADWSSATTVRNAASSRLLWAGRTGCFANTPAGARSGAVIYSLIETAKENGLDPYRYLLWVLHTAPELAQQDSAWAEKVTPSLAPDTCKIPE